MRLRRFVARLSGYRFIPFDPVLRDRENEPARRNAWLQDQYQHPEEHRHTLAEVQGWFAENGIDYLRAYPSAMLSQEPEELFTAAETTGGLRAGSRSSAGLARSGTRAAFSSLSVGAFDREWIVVIRRLHSLTLNRFGCPSMSVMAIFHQLSGTSPH